MRALPDNGRRCAATKKNGEPCGAPPMNSSAYCCWHNGDVPDDVKRGWAVAGGLASRPKLDPEAVPVSLRTAEGCLAALEEVATQVRRGQMPPNIANSVAYAVSVAARVVEVNVSDKLRKLEKLIGGRR